ncbi:MAG TPA: hypothetical protein VIZ18_10185 [Ktedonobacteraceae bacterium]
MYQYKRIFRLSALLLAFCLTMMVSGCGGQAAGGPADLVPTLCHSEYGVGLFFITIENRGDDAGPSTMTILYNTASPHMPRVRLQVKTPDVPAGNEIWLAVELPSASGSRGFVTPVGIITITADAMYVLPEANRADQTLLTYCKDGR